MEKVKSTWKTQGNLMSEKNGNPVYDLRDATIMFAMYVFITQEIGCSSRLRLPEVENYNAWNLFGVVVGYWRETSDNKILNIFVYIDKPSEGFFLCQSR